MSVFDKRFDIKFKSNPYYKEEVIVKRIAHLITGCGYFYRKDSGYKYSLGTTNDW